MDVAEITRKYNDNKSVIIFFILFTPKYFKKIIIILKGNLIKIIIKQEI